MRKNTKSQESVNENLKNNLVIQVEKLRNHCNEKSYKTRYRYFDATERLCEYLAEKYRLQKFSNLKASHIITYVQHLKDTNTSAATIKTDLSGIRFYHRLSGGKNILPDNKVLNLESRSIGQKDRSWTKNEINMALNLSKEMGRLDIYYAIKLSSSFGFRLEEVCRTTVSHLKKCDENGELYIKGKGGRERHVKVDTPEQKNIIKETLEYANRLGKTNTDKILTDQIKGSTLGQKSKIQNWIANHRLKFQEDFRKNDPSQNIMKNKKEKVSTLTFHGLRYYFAQQKYIRIKDDKNCMKILSNDLGHDREEITETYLDTIPVRKRKVS